MFTLINFRHLSGLCNLTNQDYSRSIGGAILFFFCIFFASSGSTQESNVAGLKKDQQDQIEFLISSCLDHIQTDPKEVILLSHQGLGLAHEMLDTSALLDFTRFLALMHFNVGCLDSSLVFHERSMDLAILFNDSLHLLSAYTDLGYYHYASGTHNLGEAYYDKAAPIAKKLNDYKRIQSILVHKAHFKSRRGLYSDALRIIEKNIIYSEEHELDKRRLHLHRAQHLSHLSRYSESLNVLFNLKNDESLDSIFQIHIDQEIGAILMKNELYSEALRYFESAYAVLNTTDLLFDKIRSLEDLGSIYLALDKKEEARQVLTKCVILQEEKEVSCSGAVLFNLARVCNKDEDASCATVYYKRAYERFKGVDDQQGMANVHNALAAIAMDEGDPEIAFNLINKAIDIATYHEYSTTLAESYALQFELHTQQENMHEALSSKVLFDSLNDQLKDPERVFSISKEIVRKEYLKFEQENVDQPKGWNSSIVQIIMVISLLISCFLTYRLENRRKHSKSISEEASRKHKPLIIPADELEILREKLLFTMRKNRPYLNDKMGLTDLASLLGTTDKRLSYLLNQELQTNFYDFINKYRVQAFKDLSKQKNASQFSIIGLAQECGFPSKSSFYRAFKKETGVTPSQYLKKNL